MASTTTNGVVLQVPYAIVTNVRTNRPWTLSVTGADLRATAYDKLQLRSMPRYANATTSLFVYVGDTITFTLQAPCNDANAAAFDMQSVNFTTGVATTTANIGFNAVWQKQIKVTVTAIDPALGTLTLSTSWS